MKPLSNAILNAKKSSIRKLFELVLTAKNAISFGIGQPDFPTPQPVLEGMIQACKEKKTQYAPALGLPQLRELVATKFREENKLDWVRKENIIITNGGSQALHLAFSALLNPEDEVIINSPNFLSYYYLTEFSHARPVEVRRKDDFSLDLDALNEAISEKTKFLIINSPNNPTGYTMTEEEIDAIVDLTRDNDLYLVSDEVYEKFVYDDRQAISPAAYDGMEDRVLTLNAMSKTYAATGLRIGYVAASEEIIALMEKYAQYSAAGVNHPMQYGAIQGLQSGNPQMKDILADYNKRRLYTYDRLIKMGLEVPKPYGAFYIMPKISNVFPTSDEFSTALMTEQEVAVVPGSAFGSYADEYVRISYATSQDNLEEGLNRMEEFVQARL